MAERSGVFDMIGPIMIGPSSSHTGGVVRIGRVANRIFKGVPDKVEITFYNSFARTYEGHGSDRAILAGLMDFKTDDRRIKESRRLAEEMGMAFSFRSIGSASDLHPNTVRVVAYNGEVRSSLIGESRGGGVIRIRQVNEFDANFTASSHTLYFEAEDITGSIAFIANVISHDDCNIATMTVSRDRKAGTACMILEMDSGLNTHTIKFLQHLKWVKKVLYIPDIDK